MHATMVRASAKGHRDTRSAAAPRPSTTASRKAAGAAGGMPLFLRIAATPEPSAPAAQRRAEIAYPHAASIQSALGGTIPGSAVHDPAGCAERGVPAFTDGAVTHFASPSPPLHVAAHEATHQLQHAGLTHDAGLGAERHAHAVAGAITSGVSPRPALGRRGSPVAAGVHAYTEISAADQTATSQWIIGSAARVADTGRMVTSVTDGHVCYADPALIEQANLVLRARQSGVRLSAGAAGPSGAAPDGSGIKSTVAVIATVQSATGGDNWADCGRMSREVQGAAGTDTPSRGVYRDSAGTERETSTSAGPTTATGTTSTVRDEVLVGTGLGATPAAARTAYLAMTPTAREAFDQLHGINRYAAPNVGESYMSRRDDALTGQGFNFHWGGVVLVAGGDRVTYENFARPDTDYDSQNARWYFDMYGPPSKAGQTWHDRWAEGTGREGTGVGLPGHNSLTMAARTSPDPSPWTPGTPTLTTAELITRRAAATQEGERMALDAELRTRFVKVTVDVVKAQENPDDVFVRIEHGGRSRETGTLELRTGDRNTFWLPLAPLVPVTGAIQVKVYDWDLLSPNDLLSIFSLRDSPVSDNRPWDDAEYHSSAEFDR